MPFSCSIWFFNSGGECC